MDRLLDIHIELQDIKTKELLSLNSSAESSQEIKKRIEIAKSIQSRRFRKEKILFNSQMKHKQIRKFCTLDDETRTFLEMVVKELKFSARSFDKILKVSRTIADLDQKDTINSTQISEAVQYRSLDKNLWV